MPRRQRSPYCRCGQARERFHASLCNSCEREYRASRRLKVEAPAVEKLCGCGNPRRPGQRYCNACHAEAQRRYRDSRVVITKAALAELQGKVA